MSINLRPPLPELERAQTTENADEKANHLTRAGSLGTSDAHADELVMETSAFGNEADGLADFGRLSVQLLAGFTLVLEAEAP